MTQENKNLLLKDLCARLPYGFTIHRLSDNANIKIKDIDDFAHFLEYCPHDEVYEGEEFKPYLRLMSSMTEEELKEYNHIAPGLCWVKRVHIPNANQIDWLNKKGFDYRGLIPMGLSLEAKEGMYKTE